MLVFLRIKKNDVSDTIQNYIKKIRKLYIWMLTYPAHICCKLKKPRKTAAIKKLVFNG